MRPNRVFFPQELLDTWLADERVEIAGPELRMRDDARRYAISEAVHILRDAADGGDASKLVGKVKTRDDLTAMSAEVFEGSIVIGEEAYDVVPGFVGEPIVSGASASVSVSTAAGAPAKDEDLLAQFLLKSL